MQTQAGRRQAPIRIGACAVFPPFVFPVVAPDVSRIHPLFTAANRD
jgi:hypothetical protein